MIELNDNNFKEEIQKRGLVLVDFYASWCGPCGMQAVVLDKLQKSRAIDFEIVKVNVDEAPNIAKAYGIESIPTLMVFNKDRLIKKVVGYTEQQEILDMMEEAKE